MEWRLCCYDRCVDLDNSFDNSTSERGEKRLDFTVNLFSTAVHSCKIGYSALAVFSNHHQYKFVANSVAVMVFMSLLTKVIVLFMDSLVGAKTDAGPAASQDPISTRL